MGLRIASELITFLLQTTAEWGACVILVRIVRSHRIRFHIWLAMFLAFFAQWAWMWSSIIRSMLPSRAPEISGSAERAAAGQQLAVSASWGDRIAWILPMVAACYIVVLLGLVLRSASMRIRLSKALRHRTIPSERLSRMFHSVMLLVPSRACKLWVLPGLASPATLGWWRPQIIVPTLCETHGDADLEAVFWHELIHVQRRDSLWNALVRGCRNLLWFHPCVHYAFAAISVERELACDRAVVEEHPQSREDYATCLVRFARLSASSEGTAHCIELTSGAPLLDMRVRSILADVPETTIGSSLRRATASLVLLGAILALMPSIRILLITALPSFAAGSIASHGSTASVVRAKGQHFRGKEKSPLAHASTASVPSDGSPVVPAAAVRREDPELAAAHRVGMDVLTQYAEGSNQSSASRPASNWPQSASTKQPPVVQPSWTSIATSAAERLGSIDLDRDHDRH